MSCPASSIKIPPVSERLAIPVVIPNMSAPRLWAGMIMIQSSNSDNKLTIRNSTAEFLIFTQQAGENGIEVRYEEGSIWLTQNAIINL